MALKSLVIRKNSSELRIRIHRQWVRKKIGYEWSCPSHLVEFPLLHFEENSG